MIGYYHKVAAPLVLILSISCDSPSVNNLPVAGGLFDLPGFIREQADSLKKHDVIVTKSAWIDDRKEDVVFTADSTFWEREFGVVVSADISRPALRDRYRIIESDSAGYSLIHYQAIEPEANGIMSMRITRDDQGNISAIDVSEQDNNFLYHNRRVLHLKFNGKDMSFPGLLGDYTISGFQKVILGKEVSYRIHARLELRR
ncbi:MAG TPA: hypothetical protein VI583_16675 [Cyclobacteriaceae bacterium]|nr:hypothetical protein [Cyclobacteriaceae bacterium]